MFNKHLSIFYIPLVIVGFSLLLPTAVFYAQL